MFQYPIPMQLLMYLCNDLIDSVPLDFQQVSQPGYIGRLKRVLKDKHIALIMESPTRPEFLVVNLNAPNSSRQDNAS